MLHQSQVLGVKPTDQNYLLALGNKILSKFWQACDIYTEHGIGDILIYLGRIIPKGRKNSGERSPPKPNFRTFFRGKKKCVGFKLLKMQHQLIRVWYEVHNPWVSIPKKHWRAVFVYQLHQGLKCLLLLAAKPWSGSSRRNDGEMDSELGWLWGCLRLWHRFRYVPVIKMELGGGNSNIFYFHLNFGEDSHFESYFSDGYVQPPTIGNLGTLFSPMCEPNQDW